MPASHKTLIFHIGDRKCGSTSLQQAFAEKRVRLARGKLFYPAQLANFELRQHFHQYMAPDKPENRDVASAELRELAGKIKNSDADFVIISSEDFEAVPAGLFNEVFTTFFADTADDVRIIAFVRPHASRIASSLVERTKVGLAGPVKQTDTADAFFERTRDIGHFFYASRFAEWREHFGDKFILRPMIRDQLHNGSVVDDFARHAFGTEAFSVTGETFANESMKLEDLMRLKFVHLQILDDTSLRQRRALGWEFSRILGKMAPGGDRPGMDVALHKTLAENIRGAYGADARMIDQNFFGGSSLFEKDLDRAVEAALPEAQSLRPEDYLTPTEMLHLTAFSKLLVSMLGNGRQDWLNFLRQKRIGPIPLRRSAPAQAGGE